MVDDKAYDVTDLAARAGVTPRTVHYYIQQGLLPPAASTGPGPKYGHGHLARIRLIKRLQRNHLPLAEIARRLKQMCDDEVIRALQESAAPASKPASALDYVRSVLKDGSPARTRNVMPSRMLALPQPIESRVVAESWPSASGERSQWDRFTLADGFELHVRRPLDRTQQKALERLLKSAKQMLEEEEQ